MGYRFKDFVMKRKKKHHLKNINGRCVFLGDNGCIIYSFRPEGCQLYPLIYDENFRKFVIHDLCPYSHMFKASMEDIEVLFSLIKKLS
jgi:Fe-S-cluster containining protein